MLKTERIAPITPRNGWSASLVSVAVAAHQDGGLALLELLDQAGFSARPIMTFIVKRARPTLDPAVDDVLDALSALCA